MASKGMDIEQLARRDLEYSKDLNRLCDDAHQAIDSKVRGAERLAALERGRQKLAQHDALVADLHGIQLEHFEKSIGR